jgi:hypothetical protein
VQAVKIFLMREVSALQLSAKVQRLERLRRDLLCLRVVHGFRTCSALLSSPMLGLESVVALGTLRGQQLTLSSTIEDRFVGVQYRRDIMSGVNDAQGSLTRDLRRDRREVARTLPLEMMKTHSR